MAADAIELVAVELGASSGSAPPTTQPSGSSRDNALVACLHLLFGLGSGWTLVDAISIETARMEQTQPEGLSLATYLGTAATVGSTVVVPSFYYLQRRLRWPLERWVGIALGGQFGSALIGAVGWRATLGPTSPALYALGFLSSYAGNLQQLAVVPWVQQRGARPSAVSWTLAGSNLGAVLCALVGVLQKPAAPDRRFSVSGFFGIVLALVALGAFAFALLRRRAALADREPLRACKAEGMVGRPSQRDRQPSQRSPPRSDEQMLPAGRPCALPWYVRDAHVSRVAATNAVVQLICWIFLRSLLPYAAARAVGGGAGDEAGELQSYAVEASLLAVFLGSVLSAHVPNKALRLSPTLLAMVLPLLLLSGMCAGWLDGVVAAGRQAALIAAIVVARFTDGLVTPLLYRVVGDPFPESERQVVTQWAGVVAILAAAAGTWVAFALVLTGVVH